MVMLVVVGRVCCDCSIIERRVMRKRGRKIGSSCGIIERRRVRMIGRGCRNVAAILGEEKKIRAQQYKEWRERVPQVPDWLAERRRMRKIGIIASSTCIIVPTSVLFVTSLSTLTESELSQFLLYSTALLFVTTVIGVGVKDSVKSGGVGMSHILDNLAYDRKSKNDNEFYCYESVQSLRESISVRQTSDGRGNGAFATQDIACGVCLGDYEGELLDLKEFFERYGSESGVGEYCIRIDDDFVIDGRQVVIQNKDETCEYSDMIKASFTPAYINHSARRCNVVRKILRKERRVLMYTSRKVNPGEELLLDYGKQYWKGREHLIVDEV